MEQIEADSKRVPSAQRYGPRTLDRALPPQVTPAGICFYTARLRTYEHSTATRTDASLTLCALLARYVATQWIHMRMYMHAHTHTRKRDYKYVVPPTQHGHDKGNANTTNNILRSKNKQTNHTRTNASAPLVSTMRTDGMLAIT